MKPKDAVNIAEKAIKSFEEEWQDKPYRWMYEIDIQIGLFNEIQKNLKKEDRKIKARLKHRQENRELKVFSRVTCEPYVKIPDYKRAIHPDIVIWGDQPEKLEDCYINYGDWPILWACEIKYLYEKSEKDTEEVTKNDRKRLRALLKRERAKFATQLIFLLSPATTNNPNPRLIKLHMQMREGTMKICPKCKSKNVVSIVYGYPAKELFKEAEKGKVHLGGCCISNNDPQWYCKHCEKEW